MSVISKLFTVLAFSAIVVSGIPGVSAQAQTAPTQFIVTAKNGLNIRDKNCKKVGSIGYGFQVFKENSTTITCNINGTSQTLIRANEYGSSDETYISSKYLSAVILGPIGLEEKTTFKINAPGGLNLRTGLCKKVKTLPNNSDLAILPAADPSICKVGNSFYEMMPVLYNGQNYLVASFYLR